MSRADADAANRELMLGMTPTERRKMLTRLSYRKRKALENHWNVWAHEGQIAPEGPWHTWMIMAGRGFGKTRAGAEWVRKAAQDPTARIALVAASLGEARRVMVEGESGLLAISPRGKRPLFEPSRRSVTWASGAQAIFYSASEPESLRGPQHSHAWCDELAKWDLTGGRAESAWENLLLGLRLGDEPQVVVTTTPRPNRLVLRIIDDEQAAITRGTTYVNKANLPTGFVRAVKRQFGKSLLARQELDGELIEDIAGALWTRAMLEACREASPSAPPRRVVVAVDPPASAEGDACGIVVAALGADGIGRVLADASVEKAAPERWARAVANAARAWGADRVIAEVNQGGAMVASVLRAADVNLPVKQVRASRGKAARAEPVAALYESGRVRHAGMFPALEDQLCGLMAGGDYRGPGRSPDRADALVWALTELMLGARGEPRIWVG
jgi:phage terminase large subunit-like protein